MGKARKIVRFSGTVRDTCEWPARVETSLIATWDVDPKNGFYEAVIDTDLNGDFEAEIELKPEDHIWLRTALPWGICPNVFESTVRHRLDFRTMGEVDGVGSITCPPIVIEVLPAAIIRYLREKGKDIRKKHQNHPKRILSFVINRLGVVTSHQLSAENQKKNEVRCVSVSRLISIIDQLFPT